MIKNLASAIVQYMLAHGYVVATTPGEVNIVYLEGANANGMPNADRIDQWNDRRIVVIHDKQGVPYIALNALATTEPGLSATKSRAAKARGGVARVQFGQWRVWRLAWHKRKTHPALVQVLPLQVTRDRNKDGKRTGDPIDFAAGINQHSTSEKYNPGVVGNYSEGCLVGCYWDMHLQFIELCKQDPRWRIDPNYLFYTTIIPGDLFWKEMAS